MKEAFIKGKKIYLRVLEESDLAGPYQYWFNDEEVCRENSHRRFPSNKSKMKSYFEYQAQSDKVIVLAVCDIKTSQHIGNVSLQLIDYVNRSAEFAVLIGEKKYWGKGCALEAGILLLKHGFEQLGLNRIYCATPKKNVGMRKLASKMGMKQEGISREGFFKNGVFEDAYHFGILKREFKL